ncbi:MAG: aminoglycoside phosphotransferase family protein [Candidatus Latescibacteria bacterium]|nr:aminoglycoside phosphotransferase family protein [Candidatus Latescibacterota bacterium]
MFQHDLVGYLLKTALLEADSIVSSDLAVVDVSGRNRNYKVVRKRGNSYLVKQSIGDGAKTTVAREAAAYRFLKTVHGARKLAPYLPRYLRYDSERRVLVLGLLRDGENLSEYHARRGRLSSSAAAAMGKALGTLHHLTKDSRARSVLVGEFTSRPPWVLGIHKPDLGWIRRASAANVALVRIIQQYPEFCAHLDRLRSDWHPECLIHGDLKSANCIVAKRPNKSRACSLKIVDWELACFGDPSWDVGSVFSDYLALWLLSVPITGDLPPERFLELTRCPLELMRPAVLSFWSAYVRHGDLDSARKRSLLVRSVESAGARLVQTAYETMQRSARINGNTVYLLQLSWNMMSRPEEAAVGLLGLPIARGAQR